MKKPMFDLRILRHIDSKSLKTKFKLQDGRLKYEEAHVYFAIGSWARDGGTPGIGADSCRRSEADGSS